MAIIFPYSRVWTEACQLALRATRSQHIVSRSSFRLAETKCESVQSKSSARFLVLEERGTAQIAALLSADRKPGDCFCLHGAVGSGKSVFSRAFIRSIEEDEALPVPSPTYLLQNIYEFEEGPPVHHFDLYRLSGTADLQRLDLPASFANAVSLIEWPDRLQTVTPASRLDIRLIVLDPEHEEVLLESLASPRQQLEKEASEDDDQFADRRCRVISLEPYGARWQSLVCLVQGKLGNGNTGVTHIPEKLWQDTFSDTPQQ